MRQWQLMAGTMEPSLKPLGWQCGLAHWSLGGTTLPTTDPYQWHPPSCPATGHRRQRYGTNISYPGCIGDFYTTDRWKMPALLLQPVHPLLKDWGRMKRRSLTVMKCQKNALHRKCKEGKVLKEPRREAFSKESHIMKVARQVYQRTHQANFEQEGSYDLSCLLPDGHIN